MYGFPKPLSIPSTPLQLYLLHTAQKRSEDIHQSSQSSPLYCIVTVVPQVGGDIGNEPRFSKATAKLCCSQKAFVGIRGDVGDPLTERDAK